MPFDKKLIHNKFLLYVIRKVMVYVIILFVSFSIVFFVIHLIPGDPLMRYIESIETQFYWQDEYKELIAAYREKFSWDQPIFIQYISYLRRIFFEFDLGPSMLNFPNPASMLIMRALPWSIGLLSVSVLISWLLGMVIGVFLGWKRGSKIDTTLFTLALGVSQIPYYLLALILLFSLSYALGIFPSRWAFSPSTSMSLTLDFIWDIVYHATLPALSLVIVSVFGWLITTRAMTVTILGEDYLLFARAKGLRKIRILNRYVLRNILLPQATGVAMSLGFVVNGAYLVESIFQYPGIGSLLIRALSMLDYNVFLGIILISTFTVLSANMILDIILPLIDPRIRHGGE